MLVAVSLRDQDDVEEGVDVEVPGSEGVPLRVRNEE